MKKSKVLVSFVSVLFTCILLALSLTACSSGDGKHTHTLGEAVKENEVAATCTTDGGYDEVVYCTECNKEISRTYTTVAKGHTHATAVKENEGAATCKAEGSYDEVVYCSVCGDEISRTQKSIAKLTTHTPATAVKENEVAATCKDAGSYDEVTYCSVCGKELTRTKIKTAERLTVHNLQNGECTVCGAKESTEGLQFSLNSDGKSYTVTGIGTCTASDIVIDLYNGKPVTNIGYDAFEDCTSLTSVTIGNGVTSIGYSAFSGCSSLEEMTLPLNNKTFGYIFGTSSYTGGVATTQKNTTYYIPSRLKKVTLLGDNILACAFENCKRLKSVTIPDSVTSIGYSAFYYCKSLTSVTIPNSVTSIGYEAFYDCTSLTSVTIGNSITSIGHDAFKNCTALTYNEYDNAYYLGNESNKYVALIKAKSTDITSCTINENCKIIYEYAFYECSSLTSVTIGNGVTSIGYSAFYYCDGLTSITIPDSVTSIGGSAFYNCTSLTSVTIGNSVTSIGYEAFYDCTSLTSVTIGNSITSIGHDAFKNCTALSYNEYDNAYYLGNESNKCVVLIKSKSKDITSCTINENCKIIYEDAFYKCSSLTSVTIGNGVTSIGSSAFYGCTGLTGVYISDIAKWCAISFYNAYSNPLYYAHKLYLDGELVTNLVIPDGVTSIGYKAFSGCTSLTNVTIPDSVTSMGYAFYDCWSLTSVYYKGTASEWSKIYIGSYNSDLTAAKRYYYSETAPTKTGNYWHYGENGEIVVWGE